MPASNLLAASASEICIGVIYGEAVDRETTGLMLGFRGKLLSAQAIFLLQSDSEWASIRHRLSMICRSKLWRRSKNRFCASFSWWEQNNRKDPANLGELSGIVVFASQSPAATLLSLYSSLCLSLVHLYTLVMPLSTSIFPKLDKIPACKSCISNDSCSGGGAVQWNPFVRALARKNAKAKAKKVKAVLVMAKGRRRYKDQ
ncbi:hypothetical protein FNV43_RR22444 [Rhamnella rubrinervis]|uniref:Uncharacterized protein n=1 Tax=Rhamnella rubrinervis TaxID=2594499 RepID=A0A8K0GV74_9ROSA|nr:hypothetical protein FNV43_RR22444 [Rhamnella rubrinervis]